MKWTVFCFFTAFLTLAVSSCKKEDRQRHFPDETTTGANTFGCYVDNAQFLPCRLLWGESPEKKVQASVYGVDTARFDILVSAVNHCGNDLGQAIFIAFDSLAVSANTTYKMSGYSRPVKGKVRCSYYQDRENFESDSTLNGSVTVTCFDKEKRILSGRFEATLQDINSTKTVRITQGRFDATF